MTPVSAAALVLGTERVSVTPSASLLTMVAPSPIVPGAPPVTIMPGIIAALAAVRETVLAGPAGMFTVAVIAPGSVADAVIGDKPLVDVWPSTLRPQQMMEPSARRAMVCSLPAAMATAFTTGVKRSGTESVTALTVLGAESVSTKGLAPVL